MASPHPSGSLDPRKVFFSLIIFFTDTPRATRLSRQTHGTSPCIYYIFTLTWIHGTFTLSWGVMLPLFPLSYLISLVMYTPYGHLPYMTPFLHCLPPFDSSLSLSGHLAVPDSFLDSLLYYMTWTLTRTMAPQIGLCALSITINTDMYLVYSSD
jgi:hypothetical protein